MYRLGCYAARLRNLSTTETRATGGSVPNKRIVDFDLISMYMLCNQRNTFSSIAAWYPDLLDFNCITVNVPVAAPHATSSQGFLFRVTITFQGFQDGPDVLPLLFTAITFLGDATHAFLESRVNGKQTSGHEIVPR
jgi:hypothetical protein